MTRTKTTPLVGPFEPFRVRVADAVIAGMGDHLDRLTWNATQIEQLQEARLRELLAIAQARSPFHAERLAGVDPDTFTLADLTHLPAMDKPTMMERFDDVVTDRRIRGADLEQILEATTDDPQPALGEYIVLTSGGSSGTRGIFLMDAAALAEFVCATIRPRIASSLTEGETPPEGIETVIIAAGSPIHATAVGSRIMQDGPMRTTRLPATLPFAEIVAGLRRIDPAIIMGYPSVLDRLATEQEAGRLQLRLRGLTSTSENLLSEVRARIERAFGLPVVNLYGSTEGLIGLSAPGEVALNFASDGCIVEPVDGNDKPVGPGEPSASVLVTNLYNRIQPLIRYRIEDCFVPAPLAPDHGHFRASVDGRASDTLRWGDVTVHPLAITNELIHAPAVVDYVVHQTPSGVAIDVVTAGPVDLDSLRQRIEADLAVAGKPDAEVTLRTIDDIGRNARTGKVARIVPLPHA